MLKAQRADTVDGARWPTRPTQDPRRRSLWTIWVVVALVLSSAGCSPPVGRDRGGGDDGHGGHGGTGGSDASGASGGGAGTPHGGGVAGATGGTGASGPQPDMLVWGENGIERRGPGGFAEMLVRAWDLVPDSRIDAVAISPDHTELAVALGNLDTTKLIVISLTGELRRVLAEYSPYVGFNKLEWTSDGKSVAFLANVPPPDWVSVSAQTIWVVPADGSGSPRQAGPYTVHPKNAQSGHSFYDFKMTDVGDDGRFHAYGDEIGVVGTKDEGVWATDPYRTLPFHVFPQGFTQPFLHSELGAFAFGAHEFTPGSSLVRRPIAPYVDDSDLEVLFSGEIVSGFLGLPAAADGRKLAFQVGSRESPGEYSVYIADTAAGSVSQLAPAFNALVTTWSVDGTSLALFGGASDADTDDLSILVFDIATGVGVSVLAPGVEQKSGLSDLIIEAYYKGSRNYTLFLRSGALVMILGNGIYRLTDLSQPDQSPQGELPLVYLPQGIIAL